MNTIQLSKDRNDKDRFLDMTELADTYWWEADALNKTICFPDNIVKRLHFKSSILSYDCCLEYICEEYRESFYRNFLDGSLRRRDSFVDTFPIKSGDKTIWLRCSLGYHIQTNELYKGCFGLIKIISQEDTINNSHNENSNKILQTVDKIASSLSDFLTDKKEDDIINDILNTILVYFDASDVHLTEFAENDTIHQCQHQVGADGFVMPQDGYTRVKSEDIPWWTKTIKSNKSIILDSIDQLPKEAEAEYRLFANIDLRSTLVIPLRNANETWGYVGVYTSGFNHHWNNDDYLWMMSMSNILGVCVELSREITNSTKLRTYREGIINNMPIGYTRIKIQLDDKGNVNDYVLAEANMASSLLYNKKGEEIGRLGSEVHNEDLFNKNIEYLTKAAHNSTHTDKSILTPSGRYINRIAYKYSDDEIIEFNVDITETIEAMRAVHRSDEMFRNVFINMPIGVSMYDSNGFVTDMNNSMMKIFGLNSFKDIKGFTFFKDKNATTEILRHAISDDHQTFYLTYDFKKVDNYRTYRKDKAILNCKLVRLQDSGNNMGYVMICIEDTDRLMAMNKIRDFENYFSMISEYAKIGYSKFNLASKTGYAIRQWYKNLGEEEGTPLTEIIGIFNHIHPFDRQALIAFLNDAAKGKADHFAKEMRVRDNGTSNEWKWIYHSVLLSNYRPSEGSIEMVGINYDITAFKEIEAELIEARNEALKMDKLKSAFLANMSHEIRTPLNAIIGFSEILKDTDDQDERNQFWGILKKNNDILLQLINDILDLSKIEANTMEFKITEVDVNTLCDSIVRSMQFKIAKNVRIIFEPSEDSCTLQTDETRLSQVISNFINNAIKFTLEGSITLAYQWIDSEHIRFSVTDTGIGIKKENQQNIFERFVKLNSFKQGTGLGLSICRSIVEHFGGTIGVDSEEGKGSCFWFTLPKI
jgi:PAS domain S-box-containing protein